MNTYPEENKDINGVTFLHKNLCDYVETGSIYASKIGQIQLLV